MPPKYNDDFLRAALLRLECQCRAVDQRIKEIQNLLDSRQTERRERAKSRNTGLFPQRRRTSPKVPAVGRHPKPEPVAPPDVVPESGNIVADFPRGSVSFENKAGRYELIRIDNAQAYYSFTNRAGKTVDAIMPILQWQRMQVRAAQNT
jgi:hypothetical protein